VTVDFSPSGTCTKPSGLGTLDTASPNLICVTVQRTVNTTLLRAISGAASSSTVSATAIAALVQGPAAVPIVVTHPTLVDALQQNGGTTVTISGGPTRAIHDLSKAGPAGTGADFRSWGPAASNDTTTTISYSGPCSVWLCLGSSGHYNQPASIITDPFATLPQPSQPATSGTVTNVASGASLGVAGCPATCTAAGGCQVYTPGTYTGGIKVTGAKLLTAYFYPGLYYIVDDAKKQNNVGFTTGSNGDMEMLSSVCSNVVTGGDADFSSGGMLVFNHGTASFDVGSNGQANLIGSNWTSPNYEGILFWEDRTLTGAIFQNSFGGGGGLTLQGTIYANMPSPTYNNYQIVMLTGNSGSNTQITGEVITNVLLLKGTGSINMTLSSAQLKNVRQVALVQ
jgi:hypothetical protein